ncbi:hypothetical protein D3C81_1426350 [compost metagenome]
MAQVRRQVAQVAGEGHAVGDGLGVGGAALGFGDLGFLDQQGDLLQRRGVGLLALEAVEHVAAVGQHFHQQAGARVQVAALHHQFAEGECGVAAAQGLEHGEGGGNYLAVVAVGEFALLAAADQQHAFGLDPWQVVQEQGLARLAGQVAALEQDAQGALAGRVDGTGGGAELAALADGEHQGGGFQGFRTGALDEKLHGRGSPRQTVGFAG